MLRGGANGTSVAMECEQTRPGDRGCDAKEVWQAISLITKECDQTPARLQGGGVIVLGGVTGDARTRGGCIQFVHGRRRMTIDPRIPNMPRRSTSDFHQPGRHCFHQARSAVRCSARRIERELHPFQEPLVRLTVRTGGGVKRGVLTHESRWSEAILCFHAHAMPVMKRPTLITWGWQQKNAFRRYWRTVTDATYIDETHENCTSDALSHRQTDS